MPQEILLIALANLIFFSKSLCMGYVSDDVPSANRQEKHPKWKYWLLVLEGHLKSRHMVKVDGKKVESLWPQMDHFIVTVLHTIVCCLIYTAFGSNHISFVAAILFSFNPINNQGSVWISGRGYVLSALGMLAAISAPTLGIPFLTLATYSNAGFLAPVALIGSDVSWLLWFMPAIWYFHSKRFRKNVADKIKQEMFYEDKRIHIQRVIIAIKTFAFYTTHALLPIKITFYHSYMQSMAGSGKEKARSLDRYFWLGIIMIGAILWRFTHHEWDLFNFGLLWWCVCIAPFTNFIRMQQEVAERYCYLPNVGLMLCLSIFLQDYPMAIPFFIGMYSMCLWDFMDAYKDDFYMTEISCMQSPNSWFCWHVKAMKRWDAKSYQEAFIYWTMALNISPNEFKLLINLSSTLMLSNHKDKGKEFFEKAKANVPRGQEKMAEDIFKQWGQISPDGKLATYPIVL